MLKYQLFPIKNKKKWVSTPQFLEATNRARWRQPYGSKTMKQRHFQIANMLSHKQSMSDTAYTIR